MEHEDTKVAQAAFDAEVRATVESMRTRPVENVSAPTDVMLDAAVEATLDAEAGFFATQDASASAAEPQHGDYTPHYHPKAPFRLKFSFDSTGQNYSGVTVLDPVFAWSDGTAVSMKTATEGTLSPTGTVYLNVTVSSAGEYLSSSVEMTKSGDISVPLYELDASAGVVKDYRHAMIVLGTGGSVSAPHPYEVRVTGDDCYTRGLKIWLPGTPILVYDGQEIDPRTGLQPTVDSPEGWYDLDMNHGTLYLCIDLAEMSAELTFSGDSQCDVRIRIADVTVDCVSSCVCGQQGMSTVGVVQYVCSALIFNQRAKPLPYEVRLLPGENYPAIWLPGDPILVYGQTEIDVTYGLTPVQGAAEGWYSLPMSLGDVWLHLDTLGPRAQISSSGPSCVSTELCYRIATIESISTCSQCGSTPALEVKQYIDSAVIVADGDVKVPSVYEIVLDDNCGQGTPTRKFVNRYYELSGVLREGPDGNPENYHGQFLAILVTGTSTYPSTSLVGYSTFGALNAAMLNQAQVVMPLYKFNSTGGVECDFRHVPRADAWSLWGSR